MSASSSNTQDASEFAPDGLTASFDRTARIWNAESGNEIAVLKGDTEPLLSAAFSGDGKRVLTNSSDSTARIWEPESGKEPGVLKGHTESLLTAAFSGDGKRVVTGSFDKTARIWDVESGKQIAVLKGHRGPVFGAVSGDGKRAVTISDGIARIWDCGQRRGNRE